MKVVAVVDDERMITPLEYGNTIVQIDTVIEHAKEALALPEDDVQISALGLMVETMT